MKDATMTKGRVYQRGNRWWLQFYANGQKVRESAKLPDLKGVLHHVKDEAGARKALARRVEEVLGGHFLTPRHKRITVQDVIDAYIERAETRGLRSVSKTRSHSKAVSAFFTLTRAVDVTPGRVERFKKERLDEGRAPRTVNAGLEVLRGAYKLAVRQGRLPESAVPYIEFLSVDNVRPGFLEPEQAEAVLANIEDDDLRDFIAWGFVTGMRKGEIAGLTWNMLEREPGKLWVLSPTSAITKNKRPRRIGLDGLARQIMERRVRVKVVGVPWIFHRKSRGRAGQPFKRIDLAWRAACRKAGLPSGPAKDGGLIFHDLRRSAVRNLTKAGVSQHDAMKVSGHETPSMFARYNIITEQQTANALAKLSASLSLNLNRGTVGTQPSTENQRTAPSIQAISGGSGWESNATNPQNIDGSEPPDTSGRES